MAFGDRLKAWRLDHGFTQEELINDLNKIIDKPLTKQSVYHWEHGDTYPNSQAMFALTVITHMTLDYIFQDEISKYQTKRNPYYVQETNTSEKVVEIVNTNDISKHNEDLWKEQHKGCKYRYRKGNFVCELTAI